MYNGKKLYEVTVTGDMSGFTESATLTSLSKDHGVPNVGSAIGVTAAKFNMWDSPYLEKGEIATTVSMVNGSKIYFNNKANWGSSYKWSVTFRYTLKE